MPRCWQSGGQAVLPEQCSVRSAAKGKGRMRKAKEKGDLQRVGPWPGPRLKRLQTQTRLRRSSPESKTARQGNQTQLQFSDKGGEGDDPEDDVPTLAP